MPEPTEATFDAASALALGSRAHQEDAVIADFPVGSEIGLVVLSDGMGGHAAGDIASKIVMTEVFCELKFQSGTPATLENGQIPGVLRDALEGANACLAAHIGENPDARGMGATLVAAVFHEDRLNWISVGDSPLYLYRGGVLRQLNEDHSMAPQIDLMADTGLIDSATARDHPDRNALTSVMCGQDIARIDCPQDPFALQDGDVVIAASDGLQFVDDNRIASILAANRAASSAELARIFLEEIARLDDPEQDNTSMAVVRIGLEEARDSLTDALRTAFDFAQVFEAPEEEAEEEPEPAAAVAEDMPESIPDAEPEPEPKSTGIETAEAGPVDLEALAEIMAAALETGAAEAPEPEPEPKHAKAERSEPEPPAPKPFLVPDDAYQPMAEADWEETPARNPASLDDALPESEPAMAVDPAAAEEDRETAGDAASEELTEGKHPVDDGCFDAGTVPAPVPPHTASAPEAIRQEPPVLRPERSPIPESAGLQGADPEGADPEFAAPQDSVPEEGAPEEIPAESQACEAQSVAAKRARRIIPQKIHTRLYSMTAENVR